MDEDKNNIPSRREMILKEILHTEELYINAIKILIEYVATPLKMAFNSDSYEIIPISEYQTLFKTLESIIVVNEGLLDSLKMRLSTIGDNTKVGDIFVQFAPYLKIYSLYAGQYDEIQALSKRLEETNNEYKLLLINFKNEANRRDIYDIIITPIQRIPKYTLLLESLLKDTDPAHPDYGDIATAIEQIQTVVEIINKRIEESNKRSEVVKINSKFIWTDKNLLDPARKFIKEGYVHKISLEDLNISQRVLLLFSDVIVLAIPVIGISLSIDIVMPLKTLTLIDKDGMYKYSFYLVSPEGTVYVKCDCKEEKILWIEKINMLIVEILQANKFFQEEREGFEVALDPKTNIPYARHKHLENSSVVHYNRTSASQLKRVSWNAFENIRALLIKKNKNVYKSTLPSYSHEDDLSISENSFTIIEDDSDVTNGNKAINKGMIQMLCSGVTECSFQEMLNEDWRHEEWPADSTYIVFPESFRDIFGAAMGIIVLQNSGPKPIRLFSHMRKSDIERGGCFELQPNSVQRFDYSGLWCIEVRSGDCKHLKVLDNFTHGGSINANQLSMIPL